MDENFDLYSGIEMSAARYSFVSLPAWAVAGLRGDLIYGTILKIKDSPRGPAPVKINFPP